MTTQTNITRYQVGQLRTEAAAAGDAKQVTLCNSALLSEDWPPTNAIRRNAYAECARVIADAEAQEAAEEAAQYRADSRWAHDTLAAQGVR